MPNQVLGGLRLVNAGPQGVARPIEMVVASAYDPTDGAGTHIRLGAGDPVQYSAGTAILGSLTTANFGCIVGVKQYWDTTQQVMWNGRGNCLPTPTPTWGTNEGRASIVLVQPFTVGQVWEIDCDDIATATTVAGYRALVDQNCNATWNVNATTARLNMRLDISTHVVTATLPWRIVGLSPRPDASNDPALINYKILVTANLVQSAPIATLGVI
jgi:hypothetical protein